MEKTRELVANAQTSDIVASTNDYSRIIVSLLTGVNSIAGTCLKGDPQIISSVVIASVTSVGQIAVKIFECMQKMGTKKEHLITVCQILFELAALTLSSGSFSDHQGEPKESNRMQTAEMTSTEQETVFGSTRLGDVVVTYTTNKIIDNHADAERLANVARITASNCDDKNFKIGLSLLSDCKIVANIEFQNSDALKQFVQSAAEKMKKLHPNEASAIIKALEIE